MAFAFDEGTHDDAGPVAPVAPDPAIVPDIPVPADDYGISLKACMFIAGTLHVLHNCSEGFATALEWWLIFVGHMKAISRLATRTRSQLRLIWTCFRDTPWAAYEHLIRRAVVAVYDGRWLSIMASVAELYP